MISYLVNHWMSTFDHRDDESFTRYVTLIDEERGEFLEKLEAFHERDEGTIDDVAKEAGDLLWVTYGLLLQMFTVSQIDHIMGALYVSNMSKTGSQLEVQAWIAEQGIATESSAVHVGNNRYVAVRNRDRKILKGPNYVEANIALEG